MVLLIKKKNIKYLTVLYCCIEAAGLWFQVSPLESQQTCYRHLTANSNISLHMVPSVAPRYHHLQKQHHHN